MWFWGCETMKFLRILCEAQSSSVLSLQSSKKAEKDWVMLFPANVAKISTYGLVDVDHVSKVVCLLDRLPHSWNITDMADAIIWANRCYKCFNDEETLQRNQIDCCFDWLDNSSMGERLMDNPREGIRYCNVLWFSHFSPKRSPGGVPTSRKLRKELF